ncbi:MAG TPA: hypothetical protein VID70_10455 [Solirubrobacteraceae bacterium]|jgi:hypothetical protein
MSSAASYSAAEVDAAVAALGEEPERLSHAQEVVTHAAPALQRILLQALQEGGWFGSAHAAEVQRAAGESDLQERLRAVDVLVAEQTRLGMFVGVTVGFQLARELARGREQPDAATEEPDTATPTTDTEEP